MNKGYDFSGYATRNNIKCADGRIINPDAFKHQNGAKVPIMWNHRHNDPTNVLGHGILENRKDGVYVYGYLNNTSRSQAVKEALKNNDIGALSIHANELKQEGANVKHGQIREVSIVMAGANPGAFIDNILFHSEDGEESFDMSEAILWVGEELSELTHNDEKTKEKKEEQNMENQSKTIGDILDTLDDEQSQAVAQLLAEVEDAAVEDVISALAEDDDEDDYEYEGDEDMKHNLFDDEEKYGDTLSHGELKEITTSMKQLGSLRSAVLEHGIENIEVLFPDAKLVDGAPFTIMRDLGWVATFMQTVGRSPFARVKTISIDLTEDEARAQGYIKGNMKKEEFFTLLKRETHPQTIYKKQKIDRDDMVDVVDFNVLALLRKEMRFMLEEEMARACLIGDGRLSDNDDKIKEDRVRPIWTDADLFTIKVRIPEGTATEAQAISDERAKAFIRSSIYARKEYKGSGAPVLFTTEDMLNDMLLMEDKQGRIIYDTPTKLAMQLRVSNIYTVPVMEGRTRSVGADTNKLLGIVVNLSDYRIGADKGGAVTMFEDFDIDYNQQKYLIETRISGALVKPYSAIVVEEKVKTSTPDGASEI